MIVSSGPGNSTPIFGIEAGLTLVLAAAAFLLPRFGSPIFSPIEAAFRRLAKRRSMAVASVGLLELLLRLAILPSCSIPQPFVQDDFSFLLAADTFASGRLTNPTPAMWTHFESFHITMKPTYMSMYFPAQGLILAAGKVLFGHPWIAILGVTALMCAAICWMLQAWLPPTWALLGGILAVLHLGLFSYWINTYTGAGSTTALAGALVLGAFPRMIKRARMRDSLLLAAGIILLALCRPYEGLLLCLPVTLVVGHWVLFGKGRPAPSVMLRLAAVPLVLVIAAVSSMLYYDYRVNGNPLTLPYSINRATYAMAPYWIWESPRPEPVYRHAAMRDFYEHVEMSAVKKAHAPHGFWRMSIIKAIQVIRFFAGAALLPSLIMLPWLFRDRRMRFCVVCCMVGALGISLQIFMLIHYVSAFTAVFYLIGLQTMRHLRVWRPNGMPVGRQIVRVMVVICVAMVILRTQAETLHLSLATGYRTAWNSSWYGPSHLGDPRAQVEGSLEKLGGKQLALVRYSFDHPSETEWVYNAAEIDSSKVVWAREMDAASNQEIIRYYSDRKVWLVQPDLPTPSVLPYPGPGHASADKTTTNASPKAP